MGDNQPDEAFYDALRARLEAVHARKAAERAAARTALDKLGHTGNSELLRKLGMEEK